MRSGVAAVGLAGVAPRLMVSRGHAALILNAYGLTSLTTCARRLRLDSVLVCVGEGLLFPSPYHGVLAVNVCAHGVRLRPGGRL